MQIANVHLRGWHGLNTYLVQPKPKGSPLDQLLLSTKLRDVGHLPPALQDSDPGTGSISQALWYCSYLQTSCARDRGANSINFCHLLVLSFSYMCHFSHFHILVTVGTLQRSSLFGLLWQNYHKPGGFVTAKVYLLLTIPKPRSPTTGCQHSESVLLGCRLPTSRRILRWWRAQVLSQASLVRALIPFMT